jgi:hypothetical protein
MDMVPRRMKNRGPRTAAAIQLLLGDEESVGEVGLGVDARGGLLKHGVDISMSMECLLGLVKMVSTEGGRVVETLLMLVGLTFVVG